MVTKDKKKMTPEERKEKIIKDHEEKFHFKMVRIKAPHLPEIKHFKYGYGDKKRKKFSNKNLRKKYLNEEVLNPICLKHKHPVVDVEDQVVMKKGCPYLDTDTGKLNLIEKKEREVFLCRAGQFEITNQKGDMTMYCSFWPEENLEEATTADNTEIQES